MEPAVHAPQPAGSHVEVADIALVPIGSNVPRPVGPTKFRVSPLCDGLSPAPDRNWRNRSRILPCCAATKRKLASACACNVSTTTGSPAGTGRTPTDTVVLTAG